MEGNNGLSTPHDMTRLRVSTPLEKNVSVQFEIGLSRDIPVGCLTTVGISNGTTESLEFELNNQFLMRWARIGADLLLSFFEVYLHNRIDKNFVPAYP